MVFPKGVKVTNMATVINEEKIAEILFDYSEELSNEFYKNLLNLLKNYHEHGNNGLIIIKYLNDHTLEIPQQLMDLIKKHIIIEKSLPICYNNELIPSVQRSFCNDRCIHTWVVCFGFLMLLTFISIMFWSTFKK